MGGMFQSSAGEAWGVFSSLAVPMEITKTNLMKALFCGQKLSFFEIVMIAKERQCQGKKVKEF